MAELEGQARGRLREGSGVILLPERSERGTAIDVAGAYCTIPLDQRPHLPQHIRQRYGDSIGHWEDETLLVDTTNFTDRRSVQGTTTAVGFKGSGETLHLVERFTRVGPDMIQYRATIENPAMYSQPWTIELPWIQSDNSQNLVFESACHEGNYGLTDILAGARVLERK